MYRQLALRSKRPAVYHSLHRVPVLSRKLATTPSHGQSGASQTQTPQPGGSNTLIFLSALGALGGLYYYYTRGAPAVAREIERCKEEEVEKRVREIGEAGGSMMEGAAKHAQRDYDQAKATAQDAASTARTKAAEARKDLTDRVRQSTHDARAKFDGLKNASERNLNDVRDRSEKRFEEGKEEVAREARSAENKARSWFGWGSSK